MYPPHIIEIADNLELVEQGLLKYLMIFVPPRHGKSELSSINFPAWYLGRNPDNRIIHASYAASLSNTFSRRTRNIISEEEYYNVFQVELAKDSKNVERWGLEGHKGGLISAGVGGAITGQGANVFLIDDPFKDHEEAYSIIRREAVHNWYKSVARTRLEPGGAVVIIMARWHNDDLAGRLLADEETGHQWKVINLVAKPETEKEVKNDLFKRKLHQPLWPERYDFDALEGLRKDLGERAWLALYKGTPRNESGGIIKREWIQWVDALPPDCIKYAGIDTATSLKTSADFTSLVDTARAPDGYIYVTESFLQKLSVRSFAEHVCASHSEKKYGLLRIEDNAAGEAMRQAIVEEGKKGSYPPIVGEHTSTDKMVRLMEISPLIENGTIKFLKGGPGLLTLVEHLINFDGRGGDIDDDVDGLGFSVKAAKAGSGTPAGVLNRSVMP